MTAALESAGPQLVAHAVRTQGWARFRATGVSMRPWLRSGDEVIVQRASPARLRCGDVMVWTRGGSLIAHRLLGKSRHGAQWRLVTKGDAFPDCDTPVREQEVLGRVVLVVRNGRTVRLDTAPQRALALLTALVSGCAWAWYPCARVVKRALRAAIA